MYKRKEAHLEGIDPYQVIIDDIKYRLEGQGLTIREETDDGRTCVFYAAGEICGRPIEAEVTYFTWPRIIKVSIELTVIDGSDKCFVTVVFLNLINSRLCPGHFRMSEYGGHVILEAGMFAFENYSEEDGADYEWPLEGEFHLLMIHLLEAARTYLPLIEAQAKAGSMDEIESILRSFEDDMKESNRSGLQDIGIELE
jgi:hypothetical protein